jgi:hypothetical protein
MAEHKDRFISSNSTISRERWLQVFGRDSNGEAWGYRLDQEGASRKADKRQKTKAGRLPATETTSRAR